MPNAPMSRKLLDDSARESRPSRSISSESTLLEERAELLRGTASRARLRPGRLLGMRMDQVEPEAAEEELADEARLLPLGLARRLGDVAGFLFGGESLRRISHDLVLSSGPRAART